MIDRKALLVGLQRLVRKLEHDLRERVAAVPAIASALERDHAEAKAGGRTGRGLEEWRADQGTQVAVAWVLTGVFARFLEDNGLVDPPRISGPGERRKRALDEHEVYFRTHPRETDRDYLLASFADLAALPGAREVFGGRNPVLERPDWLGPDAAGELLRFFQAIDPGTGAVVHDFTDPAWDTRFLGDLYQDLSEAARKQYALLQTPEFVEEFILERTLDPAVEEFGLEGFRMIDPACGSGHFLLGSFARLLARWRKHRPGEKSRELAQRALDAVHGVDVNPYAVAIARFRLLLAAMRVSDVKRLRDAPAFRIHVVCGDSLLHGSEGGDQRYVDGWAPIHHAYRSEDLPELQRVLRPSHYHAVVANPPYITPKDRALNQAYRDRFSTCHMKYSLSVPFLQRIFQLAVGGGFTGQITANSFMKREFGRKLIEAYLPRLELTHVVDTSGAYIPGHGTPTVILFGRNRPPIGMAVRTVMGIRGEPSAPEEPEKGLVWTAIVAQIDDVGSQSAFVSVADTTRETFAKHPWSIGGGGAAELKGQLEEECSCNLGQIADAIGITAVTGEDDLYMQPLGSLRRLRTEHVQTLIVGDKIRDWRISSEETSSSIWLYNDSLALHNIHQLTFINRVLWPYRAAISRRKRFGTPMLERGLTWYEWQELYADKLRTPLSIAFAFVATHNHFVLDRGGKVFNRSAPVIKLPPTASEEDHLGLLGLLNSSTACFWMQQVFHCKGGPGGGSSKDEKWHDFYEHDGTKLKSFPIADSKPLQIVRDLLSAAADAEAQSPDQVLRGAVTDLSRELLDRSQTLWMAARQRMMALQEDLDWCCYQIYGLVDRNLTSAVPPPGIAVGQRAFEIILARRQSRQEVDTHWFDWLGANPCYEPPAAWPHNYRIIVEERIATIESNREIALIEDCRYKRRWESVAWDVQLERALRTWLLDRLESYFDIDGRMNDAGKPTARLEPALVSVARLADVAGLDADLLKVAGLYRGRADFDLGLLVAELVDAESVPLLPVLRYKPSGLEKRAAWERTWTLQRQEDAIDARTQLPRSDPDRLSEIEAAALKQTEVGAIPVPPKYAGADFRDVTFWRLRDKLDVPKERWLSFPHGEGADGALRIAWAGCDALQLARAIAAWYVEIQENLGGRADPRLPPLLASLLELLPWLKQWHNDLDPQYGTRMGDYFEGFVQEEARQMGKTVDEIRAWQPPQKQARRRKKS